MPDKDNLSVVPTKVDNTQAETQNKAKELDAATLEKFSSKTKEDIIKDHVNLLKLYGKQTAEVGSLRAKVKEIHDDQPFNLFADEITEPVIESVTEDNLEEDIIMTTEKTADQIAAEEAMNKTIAFNSRLALARTDASMPKFQEIETEVLNLVATNPFLSGDGGMKNAYTLVMSEKILKAEASKAEAEAEAKRVAADLLANNATSGGGTGATTVVTQTTKQVEAEDTRPAKLIAALEWEASDQGDAAMTKFMMATLTPVEAAKFVK